MRILLDECVPRPVQQLIKSHSCLTVQGLGWAGIKNGDLLKRAEVEFDLFITSDQNMRYHQNLAGRSIAVLELSTNDIRRLQAASALLQREIEEIQPNEFRQLIIP